MSMRSVLAFGSLILAVSAVFPTSAQSNEDRPCAGRKIALTFDDGPNPKSSPMILETLKNSRAPATFFVNYRNGDNGMAVVSGSPALKKFLDEVDKNDLFDLGNHTGSHENLIKLSPDQVSQQINLVKSDPRYKDIVSRQKNEFIRAPFGSTGPGGSPRCEGRQVCKQMDEAGYAAHVYWHVDTLDWDRRIQQKGLRQYAMGELRAECLKRPKDEVLVILFHDRVMNTARELPQILEAMKNSGVEFVHLDEIKTNDVDSFEKSPSGRLERVRRHNTAWRAWKGPEQLLLNEEPSGHSGEGSDHHD